VTALLRAWHAGDREALDQLMPLVYDELRAIAAVQLRIERAGHTFRPTDLVSEAYLRLTAGQTPSFADRLHFFAVAARSMRQILVDHARKRVAAKRGGGEVALELDEMLVANDRPGHLIALDDALSALAKLDERKARVIELHYFGGLSQDEVATVLDVHVNTVASDLRLAQAWIYQQLHAGT